MGKKNQHILIKILAIIFLVQGLGWGKLIYDRSRPPAKSTSAPAPVVKVAAEPVELTWSQKITMYMRAEFRGIFRFFGSVELVIAVLYVISGLALFRGFSFSLFLAKLVVILDVLLKGLVFAYHFFVAFPMQQIWVSVPRALLYIPPKQNQMIDFNSYFAGSFLGQEGAIAYVGLYSVFLLLAVLSLNQVGQKKGGLIILWIL